VKIAILAGVTLALSAGVAMAQRVDAVHAPPPAQADLVLTNAHIYTPSGWASSIAVRKGVILAVGDAAAIAPHLAPGARTIDLKGATVLPGLHDMHVHPTGAGMAEMQCKLPHGAPLDQVLSITAACVKAHKKGEWVTGRAYEAAALGPSPPHRSMLDRVSPDNPVIFSDISGHSSWANSLALKLAGITRDTPNPPNGIIERDANGEPTGVLREASAVGLVSGLIPQPGRAETSRALKWSLDVMLAQGITAFDDAFVTEDIAQAYADLADRGELHQRVRGCLAWMDEGLISRRGLYARDRFSPSCIKMILDGVPTDSHTAAMLEDYAPLPGRSDAAKDSGRERGMLMTSPDKLNAAVIRFDSMGLTVKFHAAGDGAVHEALDAIEAARKANGFSGLLHDPAHNSFVQMSDIRRARALSAAFEFSPYIWFNSPIIDDIQKAVDPELMKRWIPVKDALDAGALVVPGSDWSVVPSVNPWIAIETLVTRRPPGGMGEPLGEAERITLKQAIDLYTINSARQRYEADRLGTIEPGKLADLVVIDRDIFQVPITSVHDTRVLMTIIGGEVVYRSKDLPPLGEVPAKRGKGAHRAQAAGVSPPPRPDGRYSPQGGKIR
jgi:predicted amidohydrolase YtcJ